MHPKVQLIGNWSTMFSKICTHDITSHWNVVHVTKASTRTVTCLIVRRMTLPWRYTLVESVCSSIHLGSWWNTSVVISRVVGVHQLRHLRWLCLFFLIGLSSTSSLENGNSTKKSQQGHSNLLATRKPYTRQSVPTRGGCPNSKACSNVVSRR
jgi:integrase